MNERIRELHNRACRLDMEQYPNAIPDGERIQQKFAELIVQECIDIIAPYSVRMIKPGEEYLHPIQEIKEHFGVEE